MLLLKFFGLIPTRYFLILDTFIDGKPAGQVVSHAFDAEDLSMIVKKLGVQLGQGTLVPYWQQINRDGDLLRAVLPVVVGVEGYRYTGFRIVQVLPSYD